MTRALMRWGSVLGYVAILALVLRHAGAQQCSPDLAEETALARLCVSEAGLRVDTDDCPAIDGVLRFRAQRSGLSYLETLRRYSGDVVEPSGRMERYSRRGINDHRAWIGYLQPDGWQPAHWPSHLPWSGRHEATWRDVLDLATQLRRGEVTHRCALEPHAWGAPSISDRYVRRNPDATRARCGVVLNDFWSLDRYRR